VVRRKGLCRCRPIPHSAPTSPTTYQDPPDATIAPGDLVRWNGRYEGCVTSLNGETAVVIEKNNLALGRTVTWRLALAALVRID